MSTLSINADTHIEHKGDQPTLWAHGAV